MRFRPAWAYIEGIRSFSRFFCETTYKQRDLAERAQMVIQEILENAVKYSSAGDLSELELEISSDGDNLRIAIASRPDPHHLHNLRNELEYLRQLDPEAAYVAAFARAANEPEEPARLGLARMRYEGKFELHLNEEDGGRVRVTAMGRL
jgi:hypothetical protein